MPIKITVIIPAFNAATFIKNALDSVLKQSLKPQEVIIIDDGSTDDLKRALAPYEELVTYYKQENSGVSSARNLGVSYARNEWVAFLDADDIWHKDKLKIQAQVINNKKTANISIVCSAYKFVNSVDIFSLNNQPVNNSHEKIDVKALLEKPYLATPTVLINKDFFRVIGGYNVDLKTAEDLDLYLRLVLIGDVIKVQSELTHCLVSPSSLTSRHDTYTNEINLYHSLSMDVNYQPYLLVINKHIQDCQINKLKYLIFNRQLTEFKHFLSGIKDGLPLLIKYKLLIKYWLLRIVNG